jgi:hypothetical protein
VPILVDGNNLLHRLPQRHRSRQELRRLCLDLVRREGLRLLLVFDGVPPAGTPTRESLGQVTILYAAPQSADDAIIATLPPGPQARTFVVVTDDRELSLRARRAGARVRPLREWWPKLLAPGPERGREGALSPDELAEWEEYFSGPRRGDA